MTSLTWSRVAVVAPLLLAACPQGAPGQEETTDKTETSNEPATTEDLPSTSMGCSVGMQGCPCTGGGACDPGLICNANHLCEDGPDPLTGTETTAEPMTDSGEKTTTQNFDTSSSDTDTGGPECVSTGDGKESDTCLNLDPKRPFCENDVCVGCVGLPDDTCKLATDNDRPLCAPDGRCVQCNVPDALEQGQCQAGKPHCNLDAMMCEGCLEHDECPDTACQIAKRTCFPKTSIIYVRASGGGLPCSDVPGVGGYPEKPYCDLETATLAPKLPNGAYTLYVMGNSEGEHGSLVITPLENPVSYAIVHESGTIFDDHTRLKGNGPLLVVPDNTTVYLKDFGLQITQPVGDSSLGIDCQPGGSVWLEDSRILETVGPGIRSEGCDIHLNRSAIAKGQSEGVDMNGGSLFAVNSFISQNGFSMQTGGGGLRLTGGATVDMVFTTIANNSNISGSGLGDSIQCDGPASVKIRNSIIARKPTGNNPSVVCDKDYLAITNTVHDGELEGAGNLDNAKVAAENLLMSLVLDSYTGAYRVKSVDLQTKWLAFPAVWKTGDPWFDYDGSPRAQVDGAPDIAGGDVFAE